MRGKKSVGAADIVGQVIGGEFGQITVRQKAGLDLEIGDILVLEEDGYNLILSVFDLRYASQIDSKTHEMISGVALEEEKEKQEANDEEEQSAVAAFYEPDIVNYVVASIKPLVRVGTDAEASISTPKALPPFNSTLRPVSKKDLEFLEKRNQDGLFVGSIRSGSEVIADAKVRLPIEDVFTHHMLIPATTGRGKSNLVKSMLWGVIDSGARVGLLVLDAHDEYYGKTGKGLKDHPNSAGRLVYYTTERETLAGAHTLAINLKTIEPRHFEGLVEFSEPQLGAIHRYHAEHGSDWIAAIMGAKGSGTQNPDDNDDGNGAASGRRDGSSERPPARSTMSAVRRKLRMLLGIELVAATDDDDGNGNNGAKKLHSRNGIFDPDTKGMKTIHDMVEHIESGKIVVLDTSQLDSEAELVVGNIIATRLLEAYKHYKTTGELGRKPVTSIIIEEAPRVIGEDVLASKNDNIYATIAREGRKFKVGLVAVTQLSSVIPKTILANMNTKIILGNEMKQEREALIASASQDLSSDDKNIASLDKGEAIITSIFAPFAMPIKIPNFDDLVDENNRPGPGRIRVFE